MKLNTYLHSHPAPGIQGEIKRHFWFQKNEQFGLQFVCSSYETNRRRMDQTREGHSREFQCWTTPKCRHVHDDPFVKRRLPYPLRITGSVLFSIFPSVIFAGILAAAVVLVDQYTQIGISISPTLTSVLGFIVGLSIAFRNQTAYERYIEGRRLWNQLQFIVRNMGRIIWLQVRTCNMCL